MQTFTVGQIIRMGLLKNHKGEPYTQKATIGGDLGGFYNIFFESTPFKAGGKTVRLKHKHPSRTVETREHRIR